MRTLYKIFLATLSSALLAIVSSCAENQGVPKAEGLTPLVSLKKGGQGKKHRQRNEKLEQLKAHQQILKSHNIHWIEHFDKHYGLFWRWENTDWDSTYGDYTQRVYGPLNQDPNNPREQKEKEKRKRAKDTIVAITQSIISFTDASLDDDYNEDEVTKIVKDITDIRSYKEIKEAASVFIAIALEGNRKAFFNGSNGKSQYPNQKLLYQWDNDWGPKSYYTLDTVGDFAQSFILCMDVLKDFAAAAITFP